MSNVKSVTIFTQFYPPTINAPSLRLDALAGYLDRSGWRVSVVTARPEPRRGLEFTTRPFPVRRLPIFWASGAGIARQVSFASFAAAVVWAGLTSPLGRVLLAESTPSTAAALALVARLRRRPYVFYVADLWSEMQSQVEQRRRWLTRLLVAFENWAVSRAAVVLTATGDIANSLRSRGFDSGRIIVCENGIDTAIFRPVAATPDVVEDFDLRSPYFVYAGAHGFPQSLDTLVDAAQLLNCSQPDIQIRCFGGGSEKQRIVALAERRELHNIRFFDGIPPPVLAQVLSSANASIALLRNLPVFREARPTKVLAAAACGTPVIFSGVGPLASQVDEHGLGLVVPPEDPQALADAMRAIALGAFAHDRRHIREWAEGNVSLRRQMEEMERALELSQDCDSKE